jgi:hypothetical protein
MPIADDENFYQIPKYPDLFISQYAQIIQTFKSGKSIIRKTNYQVNTGYTTIVLTNKWGKRKCFGLHDLVAQVWCEKPTFAGENEPLQAHHKIKVKKNLKAQPISINFAENIEWVYAKYHKIVDFIRNIKVATYSGNWKSVKIIEDIAKHYKVALLDIYELLLQKPSYKVDTVEYYEAEIDKKVVAIEIRKFVTKKKK